MFFGATIVYSLWVSELRYPFFGAFDLFMKHEMGKIKRNPTTENIFGT